MCKRREFPTWSDRRDKETGGGKVGEAEAAPKGELGTGPQGGRGQTIVRNELSGQWEVPYTSDSESVSDASSDGLPLSLTG